MGALNYQLLNKGYSDQLKLNSKEKQEGVESEQKSVSQRERGDRFEGSKFVLESLVLSLKKGRRLFSWWWRRNPLVFRFIHRSSV